MKKVSTKLRFITLSFLLAVIIGGCSNSTADPSAGPTASPSPSATAVSSPAVSASPSASPEPEVDQQELEKQKKLILLETKDFLELYGTNKWNTEKSKSTADSIREKSRDQIGDVRFKYLEIAESMEDEDVQNVAKIYGELGEIVPSFRAPAPSPSPSPSPEPVPEPTPEADQPLVLTGKGDQATKFFELHSGFAVIDASDSGDSNFIVHILDESGQNEDHVINEIGPYKGKSIVVIDDDGKYMLKIKSEGSWKFKITQTIPTAIKSAPTKLTGKGNDVVFVNLQSKLTRFSFKHTGESNFIVHLNEGISLANEIGHYSGSTAETLDYEGTYVISVQADGQWSIDIE
ncbi:hypothetical protein KIH86_26125 [Paenibacillus sp. HN-1]|uniref:hypothetical protein n=1 Tax=Paenibacillus TaxID=44249 RepID=UPI001CAA0358|nr:MULTISPECIES: hypothetical protein [Paenibacillus]MBY9081547.1 hypothetical protein [Paenibacillus sp. CGMCC 1.18879]MBY9087670.1 hypothetical protein [Paenibacillus sinensis]